MTNQPDNTQQISPSLNQVTAYLSDDLEVKIYQPDIPNTFDLVNPGSYDLILMRYRYNEVYGLPTITAEGRCIVNVPATVQFIDTAVQQVNQVLCYGSCHHDHADDEIYFHCQTVLSEPNWRKQIRFLLSISFLTANDIQRHFVEWGREELQFHDIPMTDENTSNPILALSMN